MAKSRQSIAVEIGKSPSEILSMGYSSRCRWYKTLSPKEKEDARAIVNAVRYAKVRAALKGKKKSEKHKANLRAANLGKKQSEETKAKRRARWTPEKRANKRAANLGENHPFFGKFRPQHSEAMSSENNPNWKGGISFLPYCVHFNDKIKETIRNRYNRTCTICGVSELQHISKTGKWLGRLDVDHLDNNKMQGCDNWEWRLTALCRSCHNRMRDDTDHSLLQLLLISNPRHQIDYLESIKRDV